MFCVKCGKELSEDVTFCPSCGHKVGSKLNTDKNILKGIKNKLPFKKSKKRH